MRVLPGSGLLPNPETAAHWRWRPMMAVAILGSIICGTLMVLKSEVHRPDSGDAREYLIPAYNLYHFGKYGDRLSAYPTSSVTREPGYALLLASMFALDPAFSQVTQKCLRSGPGCPPAAYHAAQWVNRGLAVGAGLILLLAGTLLTRHWVGGVIAGFVIWVNSRLLKDLNYLISDALALFLVTVAILLLLLAWQRKSSTLWALSGFAIAALTLTKAVYFYFGLVVCVVLVVACFRQWWSTQSPGRITTLAAVLFALAFLTPTSLWMKRNAAIGGEYVITDHSRAAIVLGTREAFNHFTPAQYAAAFIHWTRGFGDNLARALFEPEVWKPFELDNPEGFYQSAVGRVRGRVDELVKEHGLPHDEAFKVARNEVIGAILSRPTAYALTTPAVIYRGIWADEFAPFSVPLLTAGLWFAFRRRQWEVWWALSPGVYSLIFYALVSYNIPRYQTTAAPALALAMALGIVALLGYLRKRLARFQHVSS